MTKTEDKIPEGMDEKFVDKIKTLGDEGKTFLKGLLGVEDTEDPVGDPGGNPNPATGGEPMNKTMMSKEDVQKMMDAQKEDLKKEFNAEREKDKQKIESLEKTVGKLEKTNNDQDHSVLINKALDLHKKLNPTPDGETDIDEESFMKTLEDDFTEEEIKEDPDKCIKSAIKGMEIALKKIPEGDYPNLTDQTISEQANTYAKQAAEVRKSLDEQGR